MTDYVNYTAEEFIQDDFFRQWVQTPDAETDSFWAAFLRQHPAQKPVVATAINVLKAIEQIQVVPSDMQGQRMWEAIDERTRTESISLLPTERKTRSIGLRSWTYWAAAAMLLLTLGVGGWFYRQVRDEPTRSAGIATQPDSPAAGFVEKSNVTSAPLTIQLPDRSNVVLQPNSRVRYPATFADDKREVHLNGEGFFSVTKNSRQPFMVFTNDLITQVVGTSFSVKAPDQSTLTTVAVRTGKVAVYTLKSLRQAQQQHQQKPANVVLLTPNQQVIFDNTSKKLTKSLVKEPVLLKPIDTYHSFQFENTPVAEVFHKLEDAYGISIKYDAEALSQCNLTAPLSNEPLFRKLDIICQTIGATYEVWGTQIIIAGKGCQPTP